MDLNNGSDEWNGSVMAIMLFLGTVGAAIPSYPVVDKALNDSVLRRIIISIVVIVAALTMLIFISAWSLIVSMSCLAMYFMCWNLLTVIFYAWLGQAVSNTQSLLNRRSDDDDDVYYGYQTNSYDNGNSSSGGGGDGEMGLNIDDDHDYDDDDTLKNTQYNKGNSNNTNNSNSNNSNNSNNNRIQRAAPFSVAIVTMVALSAVLQIIITSTLFSGLQLPMYQACWFITATYIIVSSLYIINVIRTNLLC